MLEGIQMKGREEKSFEYRQNKSVCWGRMEVGSPC